MSFSKSKIQRFNEVKDCTPSPAKYNVTINEKVKLGVISQPGKHSKKAPSQSGSETVSIHSTPCFQTPTVPKKKKFLGLSGFKSSNKTQTTDLLQEELREKIVECTNKDAYIKDLLEQVEELEGRIGNLEREKRQLTSENDKMVAEAILVQKRESEVRSKHGDIQSKVREISKVLREIRDQNIALKRESCQELGKIVSYVNKFQGLHSKIVKENDERALQMEEMIQQEHKEEIEVLRKQMSQEIDVLNKKLSESEAKVKLLEENFKEVSLLTEMQMKDKVEEVEARWQLKLQVKEKEYEAILKECQEISEYNIIQSEIEKNQVKMLLTEKEAMCEELLKKINEMEANYNKINEEIADLKIEKHAYEVSITTFRDTIEVLKKRLIDSDRDVEQLKEELGKCEERILMYEKKATDLTNQLNETQVANEELEMQYESTSKIMQNQVISVEKHLLTKVEGLQSELKQLSKDKKLLNEVLEQYHQQQVLVNKAQESIIKANIFIESLEKSQNDLQTELKNCQDKLKEETDEAGEIRKKYIEISGKFDELSQQYEQVAEELKQTKERNEELQNLIGPYQEQLEAYDLELKIMKNEKEVIANETKELTQKYADLLTHQNHKQKIKHLTDLKIKSSEMFEKNVELEANNSKLNKLVEKLKKEIEDLKKGKKSKLGNEDKENLGSPKCLKGILSPGPLKTKN